MQIEGSSPIFALCRTISSALDSGGEAQSKHKEGFDPPVCSLCVKQLAFRSGAGPSFRTVGLGAEVALSF
jgi:hypothetical protein